MGKVFVISDTHFGHSNIIKYEPEKRPFATIEEHDKELIERWNATVTDKDTVWHLGDVYFGKNNYWVLGLLKGTKHLVMGNHDHYSIDIYKTYFNKIMPMNEYSGCLLTHIPVHPCQLSRFTKNIHCHLHSKSIPDNRYVCVSVEHTELRPVLLKDVINKND